MQILDQIAQYEDIVVDQINQFAVSKGGVLKYIKSRPLTAESQEFVEFLSARAQEQKDAAAAAVDVEMATEEQQEAEEVAGIPMVDLAEWAEALSENGRWKWYQNLVKENNLQVKDNKVRGDEPTSQALSKSLMRGY